MSASSALDDFTRDLAVATTVAAAWSALHRLSDRTVGARLFTIMTVDNARGLAARAYTSHPVEYPTSGTKPIVHDTWFDCVHGQRKSFMANRLTDVAHLFPDNALIQSLGCNSIMNLPIVVGDQMVCTVNLLHDTDHFTPPMVATVEALRLPSMAAWLAAEHVAAA